MSYQKLNICLILPDPVDPDLPARPAVMEIYGKYLPSFGHSVTWITPSRTGTDSLGIISSEYDIKIFSVPHPYASKPSGKLLSWFSYILASKKAINRLCSESDYDIIQVRNSVINALLALQIGRKHGIPVVFQYTFPKQLCGYGDSKSPLKFFYQKINHYLLEVVFDKVDLIFPISKWMTNEISLRGIPTSKMMPLPMGVNPELFSVSHTGMGIRTKYNLHGFKLIIYVGTMDSRRDLDVVLLAFLRIREKHKNVKLIMVGKGSDLARLKEKAVELGIAEATIFTDQVPYKQVPEYIAAADICLSPVPPTPEYLISSPTKLFEYMAMGKPIVANLEILEHKEIIEESKAGILVSFTPVEFASAVTELLDNPHIMLEMGRNGKKWVLENRTYEMLAKQVEKRYMQLLNKV